jgi:hypothetical protein
MSSDIKRMCKWDKDTLKKNFDDFQDDVGKAGFACTKCGRVAADKQKLCKAKKLK